MELSIDRIIERSARRFGLALALLYACAFLEADSPVAKVSIVSPNPDSVFVEGESIRFEGRVLYSGQENPQIEYVWNSDIDGFLGNSREEWRESDLSVGYHTISLFAFENAEKVAAGQINLSVLSNLEPYVSVSIKEGDGEYILGDRVSLEAEAIDSEDGDVSDHIIWSSDLDGPLEGEGRYVNLDKLSAGVHHIRASSSDSLGAIGYGEVEIFVETPRSQFVSEDFSREDLNFDLWKFRDPVGDAAYAIEGGVLKLTVPSGPDHDIWVGGNRAARVSQRILNTPFQLQTKFGSTPTERYQSQGLLIEQDSRNFIRYDFYSDGSELFVFCASFANGEPKTLFNSKVKPSDQYYLRVDRENSRIVFFYSFEGQRWIEAGSLDRILDVVEVGVFASNASGAHSDSPEFTVEVDYVFNVESPIFPEDRGGPDTLPYVAASRIGEGGYTVLGQPVRLSGSAVDVEEGILDDELVWMSSLDGELDVSGTVVETMVLSEGLHEIFALCRGVESERILIEVGPDRGPQVVIQDSDRLDLGKSVERRYLQALVTDDLDKGLAAKVVWESNLAGQFSAKGGVLDLSGLSPGLHHVKASVEDSAGNLGSTTAQVFIMSESEQFVSERFEQDYIDQERWMQIDPIGDSQFAFKDGTLTISVPSGVSHDVWKNGNLAPRLMQRSRDQDFSLEVKFASLPNRQFQSQGILLEKDLGNFIRYDYYSNGRKLYVFCSVFVDGIPEIVFNDTTRAADSLYLKVVRTGNSYRFHNSLDGENWSLSGTLEHIAELQMIGVFAGNAKDSDSPAFVAKVDHVLYEEGDAINLLAGAKEKEVESVGTTENRLSQF